MKPDCRHRNGGGQISCCRTGVHTPPVRIQVDTGKGTATDADNFPGRDRRCQVADEPVEMRIQCLPLHPADRTAASDGAISCVVGKVGRGDIVGAARGGSGEIQCAAVGACRVVYKGGACDRDDTLAGILHGAASSTSGVITKHAIRDREIVHRVAGTLRNRTTIVGRGISVKDAVGQVRDIARSTGEHGPAARSSNIAALNRHASQGKVDASSKVYGMEVENPINATRLLNGSHTSADALHRQRHRSACRCQNIKVTNQGVSRTRCFSSARNREDVSSGTKNNRIGGTQCVRRDHGRAQRDGIALISNLAGCIHGTEARDRYVGERRWRESRRLRRGRQHSKH